MFAARIEVALCLTVQRRSLIQRFRCAEVARFWRNERLDRTGSVHLIEQTRLLHDRHDLALMSRQTASRPSRLARAIACSHGLSRESARSLRRNEQVRGNSEAIAELSHHRHAQFTLAIQYFAHPARRPQKWHQVSPRKTVLLHQVGKKLRQRRSPPRPAGTLIGLDQPRLSCHPRLIGGIVGSHELLDQRLRLGVIPVIFNDEQGGFHHTVSASILSYSSCVPKNR